VLNQDQARDATISLYGLRNNLVPEIGSPSSAGPFNFGPWYFWIIMVMTSVSRGWIMGPWVGFAILSVTSVLAYLLIGKKVGGKSGAVIFGLLAALASGQVENSPDMLNTVIVGWSSAWGIYFVVKMIEDKKIWWGILAGFFVGLSMNFHFQALGMGSLLAVAIIINNFKIMDKVKAGVAMAVGWLIAFTPLLLFDIKNNGIWIRSVIEYYTVGVKKFYVPVRWLTEIRDFWPQLFGNVLANAGWLGYIIIFLGMAIIFKKRKELDKIPKSVWVMMGSLLVQVLLMRFYRGVRSREYLIAFHGYIIFLTGWIIIEIYKRMKDWGIVILGLVLMVAGWQNWRIINNRPSQAKMIEEINNKLTIEGISKIDIYNYQESNMVSLPVFYLRYVDNLISTDGQKIGFCDGSRYSCPKGEMFERKNYKVYKLDKTIGFSQLTPKIIYDMPMVNYSKK
jgi:hypothetical protein